MIKTFRGLLADGGQDRIRLQTIKGKVGYRITKFEIFPNFPGTQSSESVIMIFKESQASISATTATVNFTDSSLMAAAFYAKPDGIDFSDSLIVTFDQEMINQDIYITHTDTAGVQACNYYLELEVIPLDDAGAEYTTLKDLRS